MLIKPLAITLGVFLVVSAILLAARPAYKGTRAGFADENYLTSRVAKRTEGRPNAEERESEQV